MPSSPEDAWRDTTRSRARTPRATGTPRYATAPWQRVHHNHLHSCQSGRLVPCREPRAPGRDVGHILRVAS
eukprot:850244-Alexandrium_andersonii.AAC.1